MGAFEVIGGRQSCRSVPSTPARSLLLAGNEARFMVRSGVSVAALGAPPRNMEAKAGPGSCRRSALCAVVYVKSRAARAGERPVAAVPSTPAAPQRELISTHINHVIERVKVYTP